MDRSRLSKFLTVAATVLTGAVASAQTPAVPPPSVLPEVVPIEGAVTPAFPPPVVTASGESSQVMDLTPPGLFPSHGPVATLPAEVCQRPTGLPGGLFAGADLLIWRARLDNSDYALADPLNDLTPQGQVRNLSYKTQGGVRATVGYRMPSGWDVGLTYTYFHTTGADNIDATGTGGVVYPTRTRPGVVDAANFGAATSAVNYNVFDIDVGKSWHADPYTLLRVFGGIRYASIDTNMDASYDGRLAQLAEVVGKSGFDGAGPTAGMEAKWLLGHGFNLFGNARGGLLYGSFRSSNRETNASGAVVNADYSSNFSGVAPFVALGVGGGWNWQNISLAAGYEVTQWFNVLARPDITDDFAYGRVTQTRGNLGFDGVFFRIAAKY